MWVFFSHSEKYPGEQIPQQYENILQQILQLPWEMQEGKEDKLR